MRFGSPFASGYGDPERHLGKFSAVAVRSGTAIEVDFTPTDDFDDAVFGVYLNNALALEAYIGEDGTSGKRAIAVTGADPVVEVLRHGHAMNYDMSRVARASDATTSSLVTLSWTWPVEVLSVIDSDGTENGDLSNWSLSGVNYLDTERAALDTRGRLEVDMTVTGTTVALTILRNDQEVATGSGTTGTTITITASNSSGITGSVDVGAAASTSTDATLWLRWPQSMAVLRDTSDPPSTTVATVQFNAADSASWTESAALAADTYYYRIKPTSDTGQAGTASASSTAVVPGPPDAPEDLAYSSGNAAATVLSFTASETAGATYRAYMREPDQTFMDMTTPAATASAGSTTITLPAISGYAGTAYVVLRAVSGGVEEENGAVLALEYDGAGAYVLPRPNDATIGEWSIGSGDTLTVTGYYEPAGEGTAAANLELFTRTESGSYDFDTPADTTALSAVSDTLKKAALTVGSLATGWHYFTIKASTSGGVLSENYPTEVLFYVDTGAVSAPTLSLSVARG